MQGCIARSSRKRCWPEPICALEGEISPAKSDPPLAVPPRRIELLPLSPESHAKLTKPSGPLPSTLVKRASFVLRRWISDCQQQWSCLFFLPTRASRPKPPSAAVELELNTTPRLAWQTAHPAHGSSKECCAMEASLLVDRLQRPVTAGAPRCPPRVRIGSSTGGKIRMGVLFGYRCGILMATRSPCTPYNRLALAISAIVKAICRSR